MPSAIPLINFHDQCLIVRNRELAEHEYVPYHSLRIHARDLVEYPYRVHEGLLHGRPACFRSLFSVPAVCVRLSGRSSVFSFIIRYFQRLSYRFDCRAHGRSPGLRLRSAQEHEQAESGQYEYHRCGCGRTLPGRKLSEQGGALSYGMIPKRTRHFHPFFSGHRCGGLCFRRPSGFRSGIPADWRPNARRRSAYK